MATAFHMIDVGNKVPSRRVAVAQGTITVGAIAYALIKDRKLPKGDALMLAEIAGIQGAKRTSDLIPLCHPLPLDQVQLTTQLNDPSHSISVYCLVSTHAKTGVEMEAMMGVQTALLTIYDLSKMIEPALTLSDIHLLVKTGGKHGVWCCPQGVPLWIMQDLRLDTPPPLAGFTAATITLSDRAAAGEYEDRSGVLLKTILHTAGAQIIATTVIPDDQALIAQTLTDICAQKQPQLIITTGGTGIAARDVTPEAIQQLTIRMIPGIGELLRQNGAQFTPNSWSSRSLAAVINSTLVIALPGNPKAVTESMDCLLPLLPHLLRTIAGAKHD